MKSRKPKVKKQRSTIAGRIRELAKNPRRAPAVFREAMFGRHRPLIGQALQILAMAARIELEAEPDEVVLRDLREQFGEIVWVARTSPGWLIELAKAMKDQSKPNHYRRAPSDSLRAQLLADARRLRNLGEVETLRSVEARMLKLGFWDSGSTRDLLRICRDVSYPLTQDRKGRPRKKEANKRAR